MTPEQKQLAVAEAQALLGPALEELYQANEAYKQARREKWSQTEQLVKETDRKLHARQHTCAEAVSGMPEWEKDIWRDHWRRLEEIHREYVPFAERAVKAKREVDRLVAATDTRPKAKPEPKPQNASDEPLPAKDSEGGASAGDKLRQNGRPPKEPPKIANEAYLLYTSMGISQADVAAELTDQYQPRKPYKQCQISRWVNQVRKHREANGLPADQSRPSGSHVSVAPKKLEMGERLDGRVTGDARHRRDE